MSIGRWKEIVWNNVPYIFGITFWRNKYYHTSSCSLSTVWTRMRRKQRKDDMRRLSSLRGVFTARYLWAVDLIIKPQTQTRQTTHHIVNSLQSRLDWSFARLSSGCSIIPLIETSNSMFTTQLRNSYFASLPRIWRSCSVWWYCVETTGNHKILL